MNLGFGRKNEEDPVVKELREELTEAADHEEKIGSTIDSTMTFLEQIDSKLYKKEEKGKIKPEEALDNLNDVIIDFESKYSKIDHGVEEIKKELDRVESDLETALNEANKDKASKERRKKLKMFRELDRRMDSNLKVTEKALEFLKRELEEMKEVYSEAQELLQDGRTKDARKEIKRAEEIDAERLEEIQEEFEREWSPLLN